MLSWAKVIPPFVPGADADNPEDSVQRVGVYAGYANFATLRKPVTYDDPLARKINQPGAAEGRSCAAKQSGITRAEVCRTTDILHRRQTYEPVPLGYSLNEGGAPVWYVLQDAYSRAKGKQRAVATGQAQDEVTVGEIKYKGGRIRFIGALLPDPTKKFYHPYGLSDYALTWAGTNSCRTCFNGRARSHDGWVPRRILFGRSRSAKPLDPDGVIDALPPAIAHFFLWSTPGLHSTAK